MRPCVGERVSDTWLLSTALTLPRIGLLLSVFDDVRKRYKFAPKSHRSLSCVRCLSQGAERICWLRLARE